MARDLADVLTEQPEDLLAPNGFTFASVTVQGLPALDRLTHGLAADTLDGAGYRCRLLVGIAGNVATIAANLDAAWRAENRTWPAVFRDPLAASIVRDAGQVVSIVLTGMSSQLRAMRDRRLLPLLKDPAPAVDDGAAMDRSHVILAASLNGMVEAFSVLFRPPLESIDPEMADLTNGAVRQTLMSPPGHHVYGHAAYSADGAHLYVTENACDDAEPGVLGVYDATDGYRPLGGLPTQGIGPHEVRLMPEGRTLAVANGGSGPAGALRRAARSPRARPTVPPASTGATDRKPCTTEVPSTAPVAASET